jgi:hypothetical protein
MTGPDGENRPNAPARGVTQTFLSPYRRLSSRQGVGSQTRSLQPNASLVFHAAFLFDLSQAGMPAFMAAKLDRYAK